MKANITKNIITASLALALAFIVGLTSHASAYAATKTWVGGTTEGTSLDQKWSTANNWAPAGAPTKDDDVLLNANQTTTIHGQHPNVSISIDGSAEAKSITYTEATDSSAFITASNGADGVLTVYGDVKGQSADNQILFDSVKSTDDNAIKNLTIKLGADSSISKVSLGGSRGITLDLNGHNLTTEGAFTLGGSSSTDSASANSKITGQGAINYNKQDGDDNLVALSALNSDYTGVTNVNSVSLMAYNPKTFGGSNVNINGSSVNFNFSKGYDVNNQTIDNDITVKGLPSKGFNLNFWGYAADYKDTGSFQNIKVPNINLQSNAKLGATFLKVDIAGIKTNGYCIDFDSTDSLFLNAPSECTIKDGDTVDGGKYPGVPATSFGQMLSNPVVISLVGLLIAAMILVLFRLKPLSRSKK